MNSKINILTIFMCLILQLYAQDLSCLSKTNWQAYKSEFRIEFYNKTLELIA